jgi:hypothetical protein
VIRRPRGRRPLRFREERHVTAACFPSAVLAEALR